MFYRKKCQISLQQKYIKMKNKLCTENYSIPSYFIFNWGLIVCLKKEAVEICWKFSLYHQKFKLIYVAGSFYTYRIITLWSIEISTTSFVWLYNDNIGGYLNINPEKHSTVFTRKKHLENARSKKKNRETETDR